MKKVFLILGFAALVAFFTQAADAPKNSPTNSTSLQADPANCTLALVFEDFFPEKKNGKRRPMPVYFTVRDGKVLHGFASTPEWNTTTHAVDASGLQYTPNGAVKGQLRITLNPDPWIPADHQRVPAVVTFDGKVGGDGTFTGLFGNEPVKGVLHARATMPSSIDWRNCVLTLTLNDALLGAKERYQARLALNLVVRDGKLDESEFGLVAMNNRPFDWRKFDAGDLKISEHAISGTVTIPYQQLDAIGYAAALYKITLDGKRVQTLVGGTFTERVTLANGKEVVQQASFKGNVTAAPRKEASFWNTQTNNAPWFVPVKDFKPVARGEHPRLFFRRSDSPEIKRRAETPEGREIVARLRATLGGGEAMPQFYSAAKKAYDDSVKGQKLPEGAYTISHAAGFGMLFQLTGEKKYAELARECVEKAFAGQRDRDDRYSFRAPGGELRAGPTLAWYALAYDLCYDGWDETFRRKVALALQDYDDALGGEWARPEGVSMRGMAMNPKHMPASNHWGSTLGVGIAVLALLGDPGTDDAKLNSYLKAIESNAQRELTAGFGDGGFFAEGPGPGHLAANGALVPFFQALKISQGRDYINSGRPNVPSLTTHWIYELLPGPDGRPIYPCRKPSSYGSENFLGYNGGVTHAGWFSQGFGAIPDAQKPALLWVYNHFVAGADANRRDTLNMPHRAVLALVNWPIGVAEKNPAEILPRTHVDRIHGWYVFRNRWQDADDIVVSAWFGAGPQGHINVGGGNVLVWGMGERITFASLPRAMTSFYEAKPDGSGVVSAGGVSLAVDFSGKSGAEALLVRVSDEKPKDAALKGTMARMTTVEAGANTFQILTLTKGPHPEVKVDGNRVRIGARVVSFDGKKLVME